MLPVEHDGLAVDTTDDDVVGLDDDRLVVDAFVDQHEIAGFGGINGFLNGGEILRHPERVERVVVGGLLGLWLRFGLGLFLGCGLRLGRLYLGLRPRIGLGCRVGGGGVGAVAPSSTGGRDEREDGQQNQQATHGSPSEKRRPEP